MRKKRPEKRHKLRVGDVIKFTGKNLDEWHEYNDEEVSPTVSGEWVVTYADEDDHGYGWHVIARKLFKTGTYNPRGVCLDFYQSGNCTNKISGPIKLTGRMKLVFLRVE